MKLLIVSLPWNVIHFNVCQIQNFCLNNKIECVKCTAVWLYMLVLCPICAQVLLFLLKIVSGIWLIISIPIVSIISQFSSRPTYKQPPIHFLIHYFDKSLLSSYFIRNYASTLLIVAKGNPQWLVQAVGPWDYEEHSSNCLQGFIMHATKSKCPKPHLHLYPPFPMSFIYTALYFAIPQSLSFFFFFLV